VNRLFVARRLRHRSLPSGHDKRLHRNTTSLSCCLPRPRLSVPRSSCSTVSGWPRSAFDMTENSCVICGDEGSEKEMLVAAPCGRHWVCSDDVSTFFERATENECLYPPKCCNQVFMLEDYEEHVPFEISWSYQVKEQGEYAILAK
jgi:hypothetical protein